MAVKNYVLTLNGANQNLRTVLASPNLDEDIQHLSLTADAANGAPIFVGGNQADDLTLLWGWRIPGASAGEPPPPLQFENVRMTLSMFWVRGTNGNKLHVGLFAI